MTVWVLLSFMVFLLLFVTVKVSNGERTNRIIGGSPIEHRSQGYNVVRYYAWLSNGHEGRLSVYDQSKLVHKESDLGCGGALITPAIVQTACHCLAVLGFVRNDYDSKIAHRVKNLWETLARTYVGFNRVIDMRSGVPARAYVVHEKCARLVGFPWIIHDYGWMTLQRPITEFDDLKFLPITFAPMYTVKELANIWYYTLARSLVCLYVGYGAYDTGMQAQFSGVLRHGWGVTLDYPSCEFYSKGQVDYYTGGKLLTFNYSRDATWSCTMPFIRQDRMIVAAGDSGGPVTCENQYFSVASQGKRVWPGEHEYNGKYVAVDASIAFAIFQNALEYRRSFMEVINEYHDFGKCSDELIFIPYTTE